MMNGVEAEPARSRGLSGYQQRMLVLAQSVAEVDLREFELEGVDVILASLRPRVSQLLEQTRTVLSEILRACDEAESPPESGISSAAGLQALRHSYLPFEKAIDGAMVAKLGSRRVVEEMAFVANLEIRQRQERIERAKSYTARDTLLAECDSALRRIRKALAAVDAALSESEGGVAALEFESELAASLSVREAYAKFRDRLAACTRSSQSTYQRLRLAGTQIAVFIGWDAYPKVRINDRLLLRDLQARILDWLRETPTDEVAGQRLWADLEAFMEMLTMVNRRQELVQHDAMLLRGLLALEDDELSSRFVQLLGSLLGRDSELDELLHSGSVPDAGRGREMLVRISQQLSCHGEF